MIRVLAFWPLSLRQSESDSVDKPNFRVNSPPTQCNSLFRNLPPYTLVGIWPRCFVALLGKDEWRSSEYTQRFPLQNRRIIPQVRKLSPLVIISTFLADRMCHRFQFMKSLLLFSPWHILGRSKQTCCSCSLGTSPITFSERNEMVFVDPPPDSRMNEMSRIYISNFRRVEYNSIFTLRFFFFFLILLSR